MNVAITRARRMLILVGDSDCVSSDPRISNLIEWIGTHGSIQSAEELRYDTTIRFGLGKISDINMANTHSRPQENEHK